jgi:cytosine/adenosine deaminase-related metal-dependent hydrolase
VGLQTHLLSGKGQVMVGRKRYGGSTVAFLKRIGALNKTSSYAHSIWLDDEEVGLIANSPAVVVHNPVSNMKLGSGRAPIPQLKKAGAHIALGADGGSSADAQNMFENLKGVAISHRNSLEQEDWILAEDALSMCWRGGARALNQPIGRLAEGCHADLTLLNTDTLLVAPWEQLAGQLVHSEMGASVESVIVGGEVVLDHGRFVSINEKALRVEAQEIISRVYAGLPERMARFESVRPLFRELEAKVYRTALGFTRYCQ